MKRLDESPVAKMIHDAGFYKYGAARLPLEEEYLSFFLRWIAQGNHAGMQWLEDNHRSRRTADMILPGARSVIVLCAPNSPRIPAECPPKPHGPNEMRIADFALGIDYHYVLRKAAEPIAQELREVYPRSLWRICIDSAPFLERAAAYASGIGFIGRNGMIIDPDSPYGSRFFLVCLIGTADLQISTHMEAEWIIEKQNRHCAKCSRCIDACPGGAISRGGFYDAHRCISYLTIEKRLQLTEDENKRAGTWLFGCDICQDVCPFNAEVPITPFRELREGVRANAYVPTDMFTADKMTRGEFRRSFEDSPLWRAGIAKLRERAENINKNRQ